MDDLDHDPPEVLQKKNEKKRHSASSVLGPPSSDRWHIPSSGSNKAFSRASYETGYNFFSQTTFSRDDSSDVSIQYVPRLRWDCSPGYRVALSHIALKKRVALSAKCKKTKQQTRCFVLYRDSGACLCRESRTQGIVE